MHCAVCLRPSYTPLVILVQISRLGGGGGGTPTLCMNTARDWRKHSIILPILMRIYRVITGSASPAGVVEDP